MSPYRRPLLSSRRVSTSSSVPWNVIDRLSMWTSRQSGWDDSVPVTALCDDAAYRSSMWPLNTSTSVTRSGTVEVFSVWNLKPMTHLKVFFWRSLFKATFERKLSDVAYRFAQVFTCKSKLSETERVIFFRKWRAVTGQSESQNSSAHEMSLLTCNFHCSFYVQLAKCVM